MKKLMLLLLLSCFKATELMEKKFHFKLSMIERIQLEVHKRICEVCMQYEKQSTIIETVLASPASFDNLKPDIDQLQHRILKQMEIKE